MKPKLLPLAVLSTTMVIPLQLRADTEVTWFGFAQPTAEMREQDDPNDGLEFDADRVRIGFKLKSDNVFGKLQVDFMQDTDRNEDPEGGDVDLPAIIKDIEAGYKFSNAASLKIGQFKTPVGMDFNTSGKSLDITKRGMEKGLVLERAVGLMLSGRKIGGFGYDVGIFNPAGRSAAYANGIRGDDNAYAARVMYDLESLHLEASFGIDESNYEDNDDYEVWDVAASFKTGPFTLKGEYISGDNVDGDPDQEEDVWYLHGGFSFNDRYEVVVRHYYGEHEDSGSSTDLSNTYLGLNVFLGGNLVNGRLQANYVIADGDTDGVYRGQRGYKDDAILLQYQISF